MTVYTDLEQFVQAYRPHGDLTWWSTPPTPTGYQVRVACSLGVTFEGWVLKPQPKQRPCKARDGGISSGTLNFVRS